MKRAAVLALLACADALSWAPPAPVAPSPTNPQFPLQRNPSLSFNFKPWGSNVLLRQTPQAVDALVPRLGAGINTRAQIDGILNVIPGANWGNWDNTQFTQQFGTSFAPYTTGIVAYTPVVAPFTYGALSDAQLRAQELGPSVAGGIVRVMVGVVETFIVVTPGATVTFDGLTQQLFWVHWAIPAGGCGPQDPAAAPAPNNIIDTTIPLGTSTTFGAIATFFVPRCRVANALSLAPANNFVVVTKGRGVATGSIVEGAMVSITTTALVQSRASSDANTVCEANFNFGQQPTYLFNTALNRAAIATRMAAGIDAIPVYWLCPESEINGVVSTWTWGANHAQPSSYQVQTPRYL